MDKNEEILTDAEIDQLNKFVTEGDYISESSKLSKNDVVSDKSLEGTVSDSVNFESYPSWRGIIRKNFPRLILATEVVASLFGQLLIKDISNPGALVVIDVPSAGKTVTLNFFSGFEKSLSLDNFTPASFVSQAANVKPEKLKDIDLLPKIKDKVLIIRDLAPLFGLRDDDLLKSMGILTRVLDGEGLELSGGVHGQRGYSGDYSFMFLAASTPISPKVFKLMGNLGSRLFFLNLRSEKKGEEEIAAQLVSISWKQKQSVCKTATHNFLKSLWLKYPNGIEWNKNEDPKDSLLIISRCASLLSKLRGSINVWKEDGGDNYSYQEPIIEMPDRISQILYNFARGHALICGRTNVNHDDLGIILHIAFDSAPFSRSRLFRILLESGGKISTDGVMQKINCSRPNALREMETLKVLGLADLKNDEYGMANKPSKILTLKSEFSWFIGEECAFIQQTSKDFYYGEGEKK